MDKMIVGGMATIPDRIDTLEMVLDSIVPQLDLLELALNGFRSVPYFIGKYSNVVTTLTTNDKGDANKFLRIDDYRNHYYFSLDDDLIYPTNYISTYIEKIDKHRCLITSHGSDVTPNMSSYYRGKIGRSHCLHEAKEDFSVDVAGSGVTGFHTSYLKLKYDNFAEPNMADIWMSMQAHQQGVERIAISHRKGWITTCLSSKKETIYDKHRNRDSVQTMVVNSFDWT